ncbi:MAG TPA: response regulator transcription factor [Saprospiraceae bacterium]|nr:response regulator transcription factor [Saprospiraceae bacterium]HRG20843.1 response regulator transcription factor [Saprospiraceae bacterium]HRG64228.1 response regulator transcription factor [Saprospiraceae bacterium]
MAELKKTDINILVVEDDTIIQLDIKEVLESEGYVVHTAINPGQALVFIKDSPPDLILLDINLDDEITGIDIAKFMMEKHIDVPYIYLTSYTDKKTLHEVKDTIPSGYIAKPYHEGQLLSTVAIALANASRKITSIHLSLDQISEKLSREITEKEWAITAMLAKGMSNAQICQKMNLSVNTVKFHIKNIYDKLEVHSRSELLLRLGNL